MEDEEKDNVEKNNYNQMSHSCTTLHAQVIREAACDMNIFIAQHAPLTFPWEAA